MSKCRGCLNEFKGNSPDASGSWCELCGTFNYFKDGFRIRRSQMKRLKTRNYTPAKLGVPPIRYEDFEGVCRPIAEWYSYMTEEQKSNLPHRVLNAMDSLREMVRRKS